MALLQGLNLLVFSFAVGSLVWARFRFFKIQSKGSRVVGLINDPAVLAVIILTFYQSLEIGNTGPRAYISLVLYLIGLIFFWWTILTARQLDFANSSAKGKIVTDGPFSIVRHPFYFSYMLIWSGSLILGSSVFILIPVATLAGVYTYSAINEEKMILKSSQQEEYTYYKSRVPMFLPFIGKLFSSTVDESPR